MGLRLLIRNKSAGIFFEFRDGGDTPISQFGGQLLPIIAVRDELTGIDTFGGLEGLAEDIRLGISLVFKAGAAGRIGLADDEKLLETFRSAKGIECLERLE